METEAAGVRAEPEIQDTEPKTRLAGSRGTVLVVEDDPSNRELLEEMLHIWGYESVSVGSAEEAEFAVRARPLFAAVVDVFLPGKSGVSLMSKLREKFPHAILIGTSALGDSVMARQCKGLGADLFLGKPMKPEKLAAALQMRHENWH